MKIESKLIIAAAFAVFFLSGCGGGGGGGVTQLPSGDPTGPDSGSQTTSSITGYVTYAETGLTRAPLPQSAAVSIGSPASGVTVSLYKSSSLDGAPVKTTQASSAGKFSFTGLATDIYVVSARATDGTAILKNEYRVDMSSGKYDYYTGQQTMELVRAAALGVEVRSYDGAPIPGAAVSLNGLRTAVTDSKGTVSYSEVPRGSYSLAVSAGSYSSSTMTVATAGSASTVSVSLPASASTLKALTAGEISADTSAAEITEGTTVRLSLACDNPNGGTLSFDWTGGGGTLSSKNQATAGTTTTATSDWTAPSLTLAAGEYFSIVTVKSAVSDGKGAYAERYRQFKVIGKSAYAVAITSTPSGLTIDSGQQFTYQASATPSGAKFSKIDGPADLTVSESGLVSWKPSAYSDNTVMIKATGTDGASYALQSFVISVARAIPALADNETFSKTVLKPGSGLSTVIKDLKSTEYIVTIPYNKSGVYNNYALTVYQTGAAPSQAPSQEFSTKAPAAAPSPDPSFIGQFSRDMAMRGLEKRSAEAAARAPSAMRAPAASTSKAPELGETRTFYSLNSLRWPPYESDWTRVTAKLRAIGSRCYIYEDTDISFPYLALTAEEVSKFANSFDKEIYEKNTQTFGSEPNPGVDADARIYILFTKNVNLQTAAGYFDSTNQLTQAYLDQSSTYNKNSNGEKYYSNEKEMFYMSVPKQSFQGTSYQVNTLGVLAHEFQHMINWNEHYRVDPNALEEPWLNEGLSQVAQDLCGYGYQYGTLAFIMDPFLRSPESYSLTKFQFGLGYYGYAYLYARYLADRGAVLKNLVQTSQVGRTNVETELKRAGLAQSFDDFFEDFSAALYLSNLGVTSDPRYNYSSVNIRSAQNDSSKTRLSGPSLTRNTLLPTNVTGPSMYEYGLNFVKVSGSQAAPATQKFTMSDNTSGNLGTVILRIKK